MMINPLDQFVCKSSFEIRFERAAAGFASVDRVPEFYELFPVLRDSADRALTNENRREVSVDHLFDASTDGFGCCLDRDRQFVVKKHVASAPTLRGHDGKPGQQILDTGEHRPF